MRGIASLVAIIALGSSADAKPRKHKPVATWMSDCIHERTGPVGGVSLVEARKICKAEQPEDEVEAAKQALTVARLNAKVLKARARAQKAILACEQVVSDLCVENAAPDGSTDCEAPALFAACHGEVK